MKDFWNERYKNGEYVYGEAPNKFLASVSGILSDKSKILCLAEGEGRNAVYLAKLGHDVRGVDYSFEAKNKALALAQKNNINIEYDVMDLTDLSIEKKSYDAVVMIFCHLEEGLKKKVLPQVQAALKDNGFFIITAYTPNQLNYGTGGPKDLGMLYTKNLLVESLPDLNWIRLEEIEGELREGIGHFGLSAYVVGVGQKLT